MKMLVLLFALAGLGCAGPVPENRREGIEEAGDQPVDPGPADSETPDADVMPPANGGTDLQLKNTDQLRSSLFSTFGPGVERRRDGTDIVGNYASTFGTSTNLGIGDRYGDRVSTGYLMSLAIVASHVGEVCSTDDRESCRCESLGESLAMLQRALPGHDRLELMAPSFAEACQISRKDAVTTLVSSLAFAGHI